MSDFLIGIACCIVAGVFFGTNYLPIKQVDCGDGFFFSAAMSLGIILVGAVVNFALTTGPITESAEFYPLAMLGGMSWMLGNLLTPTIISRLGLGLGLTVWDLSNMIMGWATGSFGLFGVRTEEVAQPVWNHIGLLLCCASLAFFAQAGESDKLRERHETKDLMDILACPGALADQGEEEAGWEDNGPEQVRADNGDDCDPASLESGHAKAGSRSESEDGSQSPLESSQQNAAAFNGDELSQSTAADSDEPPAQRKPGRKATAKSVRTAKSVCTAKTTRTAKTVGTLRSVKESKGRWSTGFVLALAAGLLFGWTFDMPILLMQCAKDMRLHVDDSVAEVGEICHFSIKSRFSENPFNYVFSHFCGIVATAVVALAAYIAVRRDRAYVPRKVVMPSILSGVMWGIGQAAWFEANERLSVVIAFPIISTLPGVVALFVGFVFFGEFSTRRSRIFALLGLLVRIPGVALIALSGEGL